MFLVTFVLYNPDLLEDLMRSWNKIGVDGATIFFSSDMGMYLQKQVMRDDIPLIPSLDDFYETSQTLSRTIFTVVKEEEMIDRILSVTQDLVGDLNKAETGFLLITPVIRAYGLEKGKKK